MSLSFSDPRGGAWSRDSGVEEVGHPLQTSWARNMVPDVHSFMTSLGNPTEIGGIPPSRQRWATYIRKSGSVPAFQQLLLGGRDGGGLQDALLYSYQPFIVTSYHYSESQSRLLAQYISQ